MKTLTDVLNYIGRDKVMSAVGVKSSAVRMAEKSGRAPAAWYDAMERLAGRPLDRSMFTFKQAGHQTVARPFHAAVQHGETNGND